jgi:hypothetical protein
MKAIALSILSLTLSLALAHRMDAQQSSPWYGARVMLDFRAAADTGALMRLTQSYDYAALVMADGSRFPVTVEYLWSRTRSDLSAVFSRPVQLVPGVLALTADVVTELGPSTGAAMASATTPEGLGAATIVEVIDVATGERLGSERPLKEMRVMPAGPMMRSLDRVSIDMRPYIGHTVRFRVRLMAIHNAGSWIPSVDPGFTVTRPQRVEAPVADLIGAGGTASPVDTPEPVVDMPAPAVDTPAPAVEVPVVEHPTLHMKERK